MPGWLMKNLPAGNEMPAIATKATIENGRGIRRTTRRIGTSYQLFGFNAFTLRPCNTITLIKGYRAVYDTGARLTFKMGA